MHFHKYEKIWLVFGIGMIFVFLIVLGVGAFAQGSKPPGHEGHHHTIDPEKVAQTPPFDKPGLRKIAENEYEAVMVGQLFNFFPEKIEIPAGATVHFKITSPDVTHGFEIAGTNVNMMVVPGEINELTHTFDKPGKYLVVCNEYCGVSHEFMGTTITVK